MKKKLLLLLCFCLMGVNLIVAQISKVTGVITSADDGQPVIGASVLIKDTGIGTVTDIDGKFSIKASTNSVLDFICGHETTGSVD